MKTKFVKLLAMAIVLSLPNTQFGQSPNLGAATSFAIFTSVGAVSNGGATQIIGDLGTDLGAFTGFPPGIIYGQIHIADGVSAQAAIDVNAAYNYLSGISCGPDPGATMGNGQTLTPNVYCTVGPATLTGNLILDGQGDPNAFFLFKINGALTTSALSSIILINSTSLCNIFWQINGAASFGANTVFKGTIINNGAISFADAASLMGRGLSIAGEISMANNSIVTAEPIHNINSGKYFCSLADAIEDAQTIDGNEIQIPTGIYSDPCTTINKSLIITAILGPVTLACILINGIAINVILGSNITIIALTLTQGKIHTNGHNLKCGTISGGNEENYIVTD